VRRYYAKIGGQYYKIINFILYLYRLMLRLPIN